MSLPELNNSFSTDPKLPVKLRLTQSDAIKPVTVPEFFNETVEKFPSRCALKQKNQLTEHWDEVTYVEYKTKIEKFAKVFIKLGLERHGVVAILAYNSIEWFVSEFASIYAGGISTGIYTTNSADAVHYILDHSKAQIIIVDEIHQLEKIRQIKHKLPNLRAIIQTVSPFADDLSTENGYWKWKDLELLDTTDVEIEYQSRLGTLLPNECCTITYTSGTTGNPKAAMLSHDNIIYLVKIVTKYCNVFEEGKEVVVSYLPLSHSTGKCTEIYFTALIAATVYFADKNALKGTLVQNLLEIRPTGFVSIPRVYEKFQEKMMEIASKSGALKRSLGNWAKSVTFKHNMDSINGKHDSSLKYKIANKLIISRVKRALGLERVKMFFYGAAPMSPDTKKYFMSLNIPIVDIYGLTEAGAPIYSHEHNPHFDSVGKLIPGAQMKISNPDKNGHGEICFNSRTIFMGYMHDMEKTMETFDDDGWLKTGDLGYVNDDGYLFISGRIKELVITAGGENIAPMHVENLVKAECSAISNAVLIGDKRKFLTMLVTLKTEVDADGNPLDDLASESVNFIENLGLKYTKLSQVLSEPDTVVTSAVADAIARANMHSISNAQKIQKFAFLPHDFSIKTGEYGPTLKVKRHFVAEKYKHVIDGLYK